jgi:aldose 1-epimerase
MASCASPNLSVEQKEWGEVDDKPVYLYTLTNANGVSAEITNYGATLVAFRTPDKNGVPENIVLGLGCLDDYLAGHQSLGCIIGRYANRIGNAKFTLNGVEYPLTANDGKNHIHGGMKRFGYKVWDACISSNAGSATLSLAVTVADMEEGYPGNLALKVNYVLNNDNELQIHYEATTDKPTVLNLTNHSYFNLTGCKESALGHQVILYADSYIPTDEESIPTGEILPVVDTPYDLRQWTSIADCSMADHNYCVAGTPDHIVPVAELYEPKSGRLLQTYTTEPGIQFYAAGNLTGKNKSPSGVPYTKNMGVCFEAQHYPDSPNHPNFPSTVLNPGETYRQTTIYKACVK